MNYSQTCRKGLRKTKIRLQERGKCKRAKERSSKEKGKKRNERKSDGRERNNINLSNKGEGGEKQARLPSLSGTTA